MRWLGFDWGKHLYHASDYFERLYEWAEELIRAGKAYVDDQSQEEMRVNRGTLTEPGKNSPFRERAVEENLDLFRRMRAGEFPNGARVLRAKIDMASRQHQSARSGALPHPARDASAHRRPRGTSIRATTTRTASRTRSRASRIRSARSNSRITGRSTTGSSSNLPVPSQPRQYEFARLNLDLHGAVEAGADRAGAGRPCRGLGRSAHADARRPAPARRAAGGDPRIRQAHRRRQGQQRGRCRHAGVLRSARC